MKEVKIKLYENTLLGAATKELKYYGKIGEWLLDTYGMYKPTTFTINIYKNTICEENDITTNIAELLKDGGEFHVVHTAGEPITAVTAVYYALAVAAVALVGTIYMMANLPDIPSMPTSASKNQNSSNNSLTDRNNKLRLGSRVEDAYGENIMIPSLLMPTYSIWDTEKNKVECAYYSVGEGYYDILENDVKDGDTPINSILGAKVIIGKPFTVPTRTSGMQLIIGGNTVEKVDAVKRSGVVDGVKLLAPDVNPFSNTGTKTYYFGIDTNGYFVIKKDLVDGDAFSNLLLVNESVHVEISATVSEPSVGNPTVINSWTLTLNGNYKVKQAYEDYFTITEMDGSLLAPYTPISPTALPHPVNLIISPAKVYKTADPNITNWTSLKRVRCPFFVETLFVNIGSAQGLGFVNNNGTSKVTLEFTLEVYKNEGGIDTLIHSSIAELSGSDQGIPVGRTMRATLNVPENTILNVRIKRNTNFIRLTDGTTLQNSTWDDLYIKSNIMLDFPKYLDGYNYTTIYTETTVNASATSVKDRELNVKARRKLPSFDPLTNTFSTTFNERGVCSNESLLSTTPSLAATLGYMSKTPSIGNWYGESIYAQGPVDVSQINGIMSNVASYYTTAQSSGVAEDLVKFNYTFDDNNTTFEETITVVANAVDCSAYRQGGYIRFFPNIPQQYNTIMFSHRNKIGDRSDKITRSFNNDGEYDGVEFIYNDIDTGKSESILLPSNSLSIKRKKIEIPGIRKYNQAWIRANREWSKIKYRRSQIKTEVTNEARALVVGQRIGIIDNTLFKIDCGEVLAYSKNASQVFLTLSDKITRTSVTGCYIYLKRRNGTSQRIAILSMPDSHTVELATDVDETLVTEYSNDGVRTAYTIVDGSKEVASSWVVGGVDIGESSSTITAYNYTEKYWETDALVIPNKLDVI